MNISSETIWTHRTILQIKREGTVPILRLKCLSCSIFKDLFQNFGTKAPNMSGYGLSKFIHINFS